MAQAHAKGPVPVTAEEVRPQENVIPASADLIGIIERNFESKTLDYKGPMQWDSNDKKTCCGLVKDVIAMANTEGGHIVIGVTELQQGFELAGMTPEQAKSFESTSVCQFIQSYVDPPMNVRVQKVSHKQRVFVVLEIPRFADTPHICQRDYPEVLRDRQLYVRADNNESAPIRSSADFRRLIESAIRNRTDSLLSSFRAILVGVDESRIKRVPSAEEQFLGQIQTARAQFDERNPLKEKNYTFFAETTFTLQDFDQYRFQPQKLEFAAHKASVEFTGWPFLFIHHNRRDCLSMTEDGLESFVATQDFGGNDMLDFWRLNESGLFYKKELLFGAASKPPQASVPAIARHFAEAIYCLTRLYEELLGSGDVITLDVTYWGTRGRGLVWNDRGFPFGSSYVASRPEINIRRTQTLADWRAGLEDHAVQMARDVLVQFQLEQPDMGQLKTYIQNMFARRF
jgi:hypothetical protein